MKTILAASLYFNVIIFSLSAAPVVSITSPINGTYYRSGDIITATGFAIDATDGTLTGLALNWAVDFHHDTHVHDAIKLGTGNTIIFDIPTISELTNQVYFKIKLRATNSLDEETIAEIDVLPLLANFTVTSSPLGGRVGVGVQANTQSDMPIAYTTTQMSFWNVLVQPNQTIGGEAFVFSHFNNTGYTNNSFGFNMPTRDTVFKAYFAKKTHLDEFATPLTDTLIQYKDSVIYIDVPYDIMWSISQLPDWITPNKLQGAPGDYISLSINNNITEQRNAVFTITGGGHVKFHKTLSITQKTMRVLTISSTLISLSNGQNYILSITGNVAWNIQNPTSWIKLNTLTGTGNGSITISLEDNFSTRERSEALVLTGDNLTRYIIVKQAGITGFSILDDNKRVYPNPFENYIHLPDADAVNIYNSQGILIYHVEDNALKTIDTHKFNSGIYLIEIINNGKTITDKLIKN
ncbi:MAG: T9SS type A sorting domain-containing protein [Cytophagales bacterium]|nr:T9SS type A sorting domain-containing protein [Cytophagales bacterium]